jgi:hypothetical protein
MRRPAVRCRRLRESVPGTVRASAPEPIWVPDEEARVQRYRTDRVRDLDDALLALSGGRERRRCGRRDHLPGDGEVDIWRDSGSGNRDATRRSEVFALPAITWFLGASKELRFFDVAVHPSRCRPATRQEPGGGLHRDDGCKSPRRPARRKGRDERGRCSPEPDGLAWRDSGRQARPPRRGGGTRRLPRVQPGGLDSRKRIRDRRLYCAGSLTTRGDVRMAGRITRAAVLVLRTGAAKLIGRRYLSASLGFVVCRAGERHHRYRHGGYPEDCWGASLFAIG